MSKVAKEASKEAEIPVSTTIKATPESVATTKIEHTEAVSDVGKKIGTLLGLQICILLCAMDQTVLNTAIPKIASAIGGFDRSMWIVSGYLLFSTVATPVAGKLSDIFGLKRVLIGMCSLFTIASGLCGSAGIFGPLAGLDAMNQLVVFRCLQGIGGGAMIGLCFVAIGKMFTLKDRGKLQGSMAASFVVAALIGPTLGGWLVDAFSWRTIFYVNVPFGVLACLCFSSCLQNSERKNAKPNIDYKGIVTLVSTVFPLVLATSEFGMSGQVNAYCLSLSALSFCMFAAFLWCEKNATEPLIPLVLFKDRVIAVSLLTVFISGIGLLGSTLLLAVWLQKVFTLTASMSGLFLTPLMITVAVTSVISGITVGKTGRYKLILLAGLLFMSAGSILLSITNLHTPMWQLLAYAGISGAGLGLILPLHTILLQSILPGGLMGIGTSLTQFFRSLGGTVGTGIMSALMVAVMRSSSLSHAISEMFLLYGILTAALLAINIFMPEMSLKSRETR